MLQAKEIIVQSQHSLSSYFQIKHLQTNMDNNTLNKNAVPPSFKSLQLLHVGHKPIQDDSSTDDRPIQSIQPINHQFQEFLHIIGNAIQSLQPPSPMPLTMTGDFQQYFNDGNLLEELQRAAKVEIDDIISPQIELYQKQLLCENSKVNNLYDQIVEVNWMNAQKEEILKRGRSNLEMQRGCFQGINENKGEIKSLQDRKFEIEQKIESLGDPLKPNSETIEKLQEIYQQKERGEQKIDKLLTQKTKIENEKQHIQRQIHEIEQQTIQQRAQLQSIQQQILTMIKSEHTGSCEGNRRPFKHKIICIIFFVWIIANAFITMQSL